MNSYINEVCVKWRKEIDDKILGEIKQKAIENGIKTEYLLNEKAIINALEKQIPKKVNNLEVFCDIGACIPKTKSGNCPVCNNFMIGNHAYCNDCGQALDWSDSK